MAEVRRQLTLFVPGEAASAIEAVRERVDPVQFGLIAAHVTLCREDEIADLATITPRLRAVAFGPLRLRFGRPRSSGHALWLECIWGEERFHALRRHLLAPRDVREQKPHITLAHPRNPKAPGNSPGSASSLPDVLDITFPSVHLIEQELGRRWRVLEGYDLAGGAA